MVTSFSIATAKLAKKNGVAQRREYQARSSYNHYFIICHFSHFTQVRRESDCIFTGIAQEGAAQLLQCIDEVFFFIP